MNQYLTDNEPDSSGPLGECRYNCGNSEHVGNHKYVCLHPDHWNKSGPLQFIIDTTDRLLNQ